MPDEKAHQRLLGRTPVVEDPMAELAKGVTPVVPCPNCGRAVLGVVGGDCEYALPPDVGVYLFNGPSTLVNTLLNRYTYRLAPCGCRVPLEWAGSFHAEVTRRKNGEPAWPVVAFTDQERDHRAAAVIREIALVANCKANVTSPEIRFALEVALSILYDHLVRTKPSAGAGVAAVVDAVSPAVKQWCDHAGLCRPDVLGGFPEAVPPPQPVAAAPRVVPRPVTAGGDLPGVVKAAARPPAPAFARKPRKVVRKKPGGTPGRSQGG